MNIADLPSTGLITVGSRVTYRLGLAGTVEAIRAFRAFAQARLGPGQRVEDVRDARPEIRSALERAEKFLGLSALLSVLLAAVAVALAARRYLKRHLDGCAVMRCLGASQGLIVRLHVQQFVALGFAASRGGLHRRRCRPASPLGPAEAAGRYRSAPAWPGSRGAGICRRFRAAAGVCHSAAGRVAQSAPAARAAP